MTDPLSRLVAEATSDIERRTEAALASSHVRVSSYVAEQLHKMLQRRAEAGELAESIQGISRDDLGIISCMIDGLTTEEACDQLGISPSEYEIARNRILASIDRHNRLVLLRARAEAAGSRLGRRTA